MIFLSAKENISFYKIIFIFFISSLLFHFSCKTSPSFSDEAAKRESNLRQINTDKFNKSSQNSINNSKASNSGLRPK
ncbi:MAG: hypothetical protein ACK5D5_13640 [Bacteroidota bacterium]